MVDQLQLRGNGTLLTHLPVKGRRRELVICPGAKRKEVIQNKHNMAHLGINKTTARVMLDWY